MTLRFMESFDHYNAVTDLVLGKWSSQGVNAFVSGRLGSAKAASLTNTAATMVKVLDSQQVWIIGFAVLHQDGTNGGQCIRVYDSATNQFDIRFDTSLMKHYVTRNGTTLAYTTRTFRYATWYYIEIRVKIHDTAGEVEMQIDGVPETLSFTSGEWNTQDTQTSANATADRAIWIGAGTSSANATWIDDIYICDGVDATATQGAPYNDFLGECRVQCIMPSGNGNSSQLVGSDGNSTDNYLLVDETSGTFSTDYVESSTVSDKDTYAYPDISPTTGTVHAVSIVPLAAKTDAGTRKIATVARLSGGTEADSSDITLNTTYNWYPDIRTTKPGSGSWSISDVNGAEFGVKVTA